jgi:hypothetical protein
VSKSRDYERCTQHRLQAILTIDGQDLCYACVVCALYADTDTTELAELLGRSIRAVAQVAHKYGVYKSAEYMATHDCGRIKPGNVPHNKGQRSGVAENNWCPIGTIRPDAEGYLRIKVREWRPGDHAFGFGNTRIWPRLNRHNWEKHYGPIPAGHAVVFKDGNRSNCEPENLELVSRAALMRRNTVHNLPPELKKVIHLSGVLHRKIRTLREKQSQGSV